MNGDNIFKNSMVYNMDVAKRTHIMSGNPNEL